MIAFLCDVGAKPLVDGLSGGRTALVVIIYNLDLETRESDGTQSRSKSAQRAADSGQFSWPESRQWYPVAIFCYTTALLGYI
jgi:hypothetical protein